LNAVNLARLTRWHPAPNLWSHGRLLVRITAKELAGRYAGSVLGIAWALFGPLLILTLYTVTYTLVLRVQVEDLATVQYAVFILAGLIPFVSTAEALTHGVNSVVANRALLANIVFPIDLAPVKAMLQSQVVMIVGMIALVIGQLATGHVHETVILLPVVWALQMAAVTGVVWLMWSNCGSYSTTR
jgi:lipopolysaccharide transport system permease protein